MEKKRKGKRKEKAATRLARGEITGDVKPYIGERGKETGLMSFYSRCHSVRVSFFRFEKKFLVR